MKLTILGCYSATPRTFNNTTSQVLEINNHLFLIDCGEATQVALRKNKIKFSRINHIFISHLHGDHFFGLPGIVSTFRLLGRESELHIHGPKGIKQAITLLLKLGDSWTNYPLFFHELDSKESVCVFEDTKVEVHTIPLNHRIYTNGFLFKEKPGLRKLNINAVLNYDIHQAYYNKIKQGADAILEDGTVIPNNQITHDPEPPKSYAFCSDTSYKPDIIKQIQNVTVLYHEATFIEQHAELAKKTKHSTANEAARIAKAANVSHLILGHYSTRYDSIEVFKEEASTVFEKVFLAEDGKVFSF
ncbi:ribonuclease Z [Ascidiimonas sp. W6]|uniref:ribonuclease Z n=1 Tax=Ascidiimonas meishanensis TaxID=3128903 RepID=UPI0030EF580D